MGCRGEVFENVSKLQKHVKNFVYIANYWSGMNNTAFVVVFTNLCEWDHFETVQTSQKHDEK